MITRHTYTLTYEHAGQRIRDEVIQWRLFGMLPLLTQRREIWRKAAAISDELRSSVLAADSDQLLIASITAYLIGGAV